MLAFFGRLPFVIFAVGLYAGMKSTCGLIMGPRGTNGTVCQASATGLELSLVEELVVARRGRTGGGLGGPVGRTDRYGDDGPLADGKRCVVAEVGE